MNNFKIGIIGAGWIGSQFRRYFEEVRGHTRGEDLFLYDADESKNLKGVDC